MIIVAALEALAIGMVLPFLSVLTAPEQLFNNQLIQPLIRQLNITSPQKLLFLIVVGFSATTLISGASRLLLLWAITKITSALSSDLSVSAYRRTLYQPYIVHLSRNSSVFIAGINGKTAEIVWSIVMPIILIFSACLMFFMIISTLLFVDATITFIALSGFSFIYSVVIFFTKNNLKKNGKLIAEQSNQIQKALQEGMGGIRDILIDSTQETYCNIYQNSVRPMRQAQANIQIIGGSPRYMIEAFGMVVIAGLAFSLAKREEGIFTALPLIGVLVLSVQRLLPLMQQCYASWTQIRGAESTLGDVLELLNQPLPKNINNTTKDPILFRKLIKIDNLSFRYSEKSKWVLKDLNLSINKGEIIGIMGKTGSGKSTFLDILMGLLPPTTGNLIIDSQKLSSGNINGWQVHIAHVPQAIFLADITIAENIAFGVPSALIDQARLKDAAAKAQIADTIASLPLGYDTLVGERGVRLSGGQRQRIGIARALYKDAAVIIFDEATSALDTETELAVMSVIRQLSSELTIIMVAHRLSTLQDCTQIVEIENGRVKRIGVYADMINK